MEDNRNSPHVLYLSHDGLADPLGQSQIWPYLERLSDQNVRFTLITFEKKSNRSELGDLQSRCTSKGIRWIPLNYHRRLPILSTLFDLWKLKRRTYQLFKDDRFDLVHCRSYITSLIGVRLKNKFGIKFLFDMRGFWADERRDGGIWREGNLVHRALYAYFKKREKQFLQTADHIVVLTKSAAEEIKRWNVCSTAMTVIPTCVDLELFDPSSVSKDDGFRRRQSIQLNSSDFVLIYVGSWRTWYLMDEVFLCFSALRKQKENARLLILTTDIPNLDAFAYRPDVRIVSAPRQDMPSWIGIADAAIMFIKPTYSKKASAATKFAEILAMNVQVVTNLGWGDMEHYSHYIHCPEEFSAGAYDKLWREFKPIGGLRQLATNHFSLGEAIKKYTAIYSLMGLKVTNHPVPESNP